MHYEDAIWFLPKDYKLKNKLKKESQGYCIRCQKPLTFYGAIYCPTCTTEKHTFSFYGVVKFSTIGEITKPYQQFLHIRFFGCNAHINYRDKKENRIRNKVQQETILRAETILNNILSKHPYLNLVYNNLHTRTRITKRLVYNATLYYLGHYKHNSFLNEEQFYSSLCFHIETEIKRLNIRLSRVNKEEVIQPFRQIPNTNRKHSTPARYSKKLVEQLNIAIKPIIEEIFKE